MKKLYTLGIALSMVAFGTQSMAQVKVHNIDNSSISRTVSVQSKEVSFTTRTAEMESSVVNKTAPTSKNGDVYFSEDFSNGLSGQDGNGAWSVGGPDGSLWFKTFPVGEVDGYDPEAAVLGGTHPVYGTKIPMYFGLRDVVSSPTRNNGVMMLDIDRRNSLSTVENPFDPEIHNPDDFFVDDTARATLTSPPINLTGYETALVTFYQGVRLCCGSYKLTLEVSFDDQATWEDYDIFFNFGGTGNADVDLQVAVDITDALQEASSLEEVYVRFNWDGNQTTYFWTIDDFAISSLPDNDLIAGRTFTNVWATHIPPADEEGMVTVSEIVFSDYINDFEYENQPEYYTRPYNFGMEVRNAGANLQTGVVLIVTGTSPSGGTKTWESDPIELEQGVTDTLWIHGALITEFPSGEVEVGPYSFTFEVTQDVLDDRPSDNIGATRTARISNEADNDGRAIMQNGTNFGYVFIPANENLKGRNMINGTGYVFPELESGVGPKYITHVEAVFLNHPDYQTVPGREVYFNVRKNHVYDEVQDDESTYSEPLFGTGDGTDYQDEELEHVITSADLNNNWVSFELPTPVAIEPGVVYLAEMRIPDAAGPIVYLIGSGGSAAESWGSLHYVADATPFKWTISGATMALRFRTAGEPDGIDKISFESGLTLIQNYPNPFTDMTKIQYMIDKSSKVNFEVRDLTGKLVYSKDLGNIPANAPQTFELQRGNLTAGIYTYTIATSEFNVTRKLMVE